jgi:hypothetical protein
MSRPWLRWIILLTIAWSVTAQATVGSFRGKIVSAPAGQAREGWVFVQGPNGNLRLVDVRRAEIVFDEDFRGPASLSPSAKLLLQGAEVRVLGEQQQGEWRALRVEILHLAAATRANT